MAVTLRAVQITAACQSTCSPWATIADVCSPCDEYTMDALLLDDMLQVSSDILYELSGRQFAGICKDTVRPCLRSTNVDYGRPIRPPYPFGGPYGYWPAGANYGNPGSGFWMTNRSDRAGGQVFPEITLGVYPIDQVLSIKIDGQDLPKVDPVTGAENWRVDDNRWLVRLADPHTGSNPGWPGTQRMDLPDTEIGTWSVTLAYGTPPPPGGVKAAAYLGCQLALACQPESGAKCQLPQRVTSLVRQGVSMVVLDPLAFLDKGRTGMPIVDYWLMSVNPRSIRRRSTVMSPDVRARVRRTGV